MNLIHHYICRSARWDKTLKTVVIPWALNGIEPGPEMLEVGPGPGLTTDILRHLTKKLTCVEIDPVSADSLRKRISDKNVSIHQGDVSALPFGDHSFSTVVSFTMLHHIPSETLQDRGLKEIFRVLKKGGTFAGTDSMPSIMMRLIHIADTMTLVNPDTFGFRLEAAGFSQVSIEVTKERFRFRAQRS